MLFRNKIVWLGEEQNCLEEEQSERLRLKSSSTLLPSSIAEIKKRRLKLRLSSTD